MGRAGPCHDGAHSGQTGRVTERRLSVSWEGLERRALLHVPSREGPRPLLLALHGTGGSARLMASITGLNALADAQGFLVAYPQGLGKAGTEDPALGAAWNAGPGLGCPAFADADDVGFLRTLVDRIAAEHPIASARVFLCGLSNGGRMAYRMALEASDRIAAIAVVAGAWDGVGAAPPRPVSTLILHGTADAYIPYEGGRGSKGRAVAHLPVPEAAFRWGRLMGCGGKPRRALVAGGFTDTMQEGGTEVSLHTLSGGGHAWPGGRAWSPSADRPLAEPSASSLMWDFFSRHPMESA